MKFNVYQKTIEMKNQIGIWVDTKKAVIISLKENETSIKTLESAIEHRERFAGEKNQMGRFGEQSFEQEKHKDNKFKNQERLFLKEILSEIGGVDSIVLFGPAYVKNHLEKEIKSHRDISNKLVGVVTTDNMTKNQMSEWVNNYYH